LGNAVGCGPAGGRDRNRDRFDVSAFGDIAISQDGVPLDMRDTVTYRGVLFSDTPNVT